MRLSTVLSSACLAALILAACSSSTENLGDTGARDSGPRADATPGRDASANGDAMSDRDAAPADAEPADAINTDARPLDATPGDTGSIDAEPADTGTASTRGTCTSSADCGGEPCLAIPNDPRGWHTCAGLVPVEATQCSGTGPDQCCMSSECMTGMNGGCFLGPLHYCGGAHPIPSNICVYDECASDSDCTAGGTGVCVPGRAFGEERAVCTYGDCRYDSDCVSRSGGACVPFFAPCTRRMAGFNCTYDDSGCRSDDDCRNTPGGYCAPGPDGHSTCEQFIPPP